MIFFLGAEGESAVCEEVEGEIVVGGVDESLLEESVPMCTITGVGDY